ncbi:hypothetical protein [Kribbella sp. VKM Ac-2566]|uniref:hypothetical protein n=1 Tax=Kribbella sp. VKM Ac-2566 TaxID=2512218 RepID=UPI0010638140|nr:hypothetical protein [Kribbella sp. VKM Ac-2566]TDW88785.1 hypothetical protein EV647_5795 [Kribbella sp. VKM Ac-2566]
MATPRKPRRKTTATGLNNESRADFRDQLANLHRTKPDTGNDDRHERGDADRPLTPREEYRAALDELNQYSHNNETAEALEARERFEQADRRRPWWRL